MEEEHPGCQRLHKAVVGEGLVTREDVGGASPDVILSLIHI